MPNFMPGLELSERFFIDAIQPLMDGQFPHLAYSAARLGWGSDVIGFDTPMSMDHGWGPKITLFLLESDYEAYHTLIDNYLANHLPFTICGFPTHFGEPLSDGGVMALKETYPIHHMVTISTPERFFADYLGVDIFQIKTPATWLTIPQQRLRTVRAGRIYHDGLDALSAIRRSFHWYPDDLWLYLLANQWQRIGQEEAFVGRTGQLGDALGSRLIASRIVRDLMCLGFLMEKQYAPYSKWFSDAFCDLDLAPKILPLLIAVMNSTNWKERESHLSKAYVLMAEKHNALNITPHINPEVSHFHNRPFLVPHAARFTDALLAQIKDPQVSILPKHLGSVDQISDNTDVLDEISRCQSLRVLYQEQND